MESILQRVMPRYAGARPLLAYVLAVVFLALGLAIWRTGPLAHLFTVSCLLWLAINLLAEFLWLETVSGDCTDSMASTANISVIFLLPLAPCLWIIGASVFFATRFLQRRDWFKAAFGLGQMILTTFAAYVVFHALHRGPLTVEALHTPVALAAMIAAALTYFLVNTMLVTGAVSLERKAPFWAGWRANYAYRNSLFTALALNSLSPLLVLSFLSLGYLGVVLFFVPLLVIKNQNKEYLDLQKMTKALISSERMAAKGEMAAEVAHEINNYLAVLSARTQLLQIKATRGQDEKLRADAEIIQQQVGRMNTLAQGLLGFSHKGIRIQALDLNKLIADTVEFVRPQNLFDGCDLGLELDPEVGEIQADGGQLQQVLINLLRNAAQAMGEKKGPIRIRSQSLRKGMLRISVADTGPGIPKHRLQTVFEPGHTTKADGHGFGLATCYRILQNHGGRIWVESEPGQGATFIMEFPRAAADPAGTPPPDPGHAGGGQEGEDTGAAATGTGGLYGSP